MRNIGIKRILIHICALFILLLLAACSNAGEPEIEEEEPPFVYEEPYEEVMLAPYWEEEPEDEGPSTEARRGYIFAEDALEDFLFLSDFLRDSFPFLDALRRVYGLDFEALVEEYYQMFSQQEGEIALESHLLMLDAFLNIIRRGERNIGHLYMVDAAYFAYFKLWVGEWRPFTDPESIHTYEMLGVDLDNLAASARLVWDYVGSNLQFAYHWTESAAYVRIDSFMPAYLERDLAALREFYSFISGYYDRLIIDISRNIGGGVTWYELFVLPNVYEMPQAELLPGFIRNCPLSLELARIWDIPYCSINAFDFDSFPELHREDFQHLRYMLQFSLPEFEPVERLFHGDIYIIIGPHSLSGADAFARFARATGFATLVGEPTGGIGGGAEAIGGSVADYIALPNSGLIFRLDLMYSINERGLWNEEVGTMPDIPTMQGKTALETVLYVIRQGG